MAGRDGEEPKEGVDFKWVKGEGTNAKVRKFFSAAEKAEMGKPKASAKAAPKAPAKAKAMETPRPKARPAAPALPMMHGREDDKKGGRMRSEGKSPVTSRQTMGPAPKPATPSRKEANLSPTPSNSRRKDEAGASQMVSFKEWQNMTRAQRQKAGLPVSEIGGQDAFDRFTAGITGRQKVVKRK
jgi:hypothetical protein